MTSFRCFDDYDVNTVLFLTMSRQSNEKNCGDVFCYTFANGDVVSIGPEKSRRVALGSVYMEVGDPR